MPTAARSIRREHVEAFIAAELERTVASSAATRYRSLQQLFGWLDEGGEIDGSPVTKTRPPKIPEKPVPVLHDEDAPTPEEIHAVHLAWAHAAA
jgi:site-specific recombinase XerC